MFVRLARATKFALSLDLRRISTSCRLHTKGSGNPFDVMSQLSHIPDVEQLSPRVIRLLGCNPGPFTLQGTNTYLVGSENSRILIDAGEPDKPEYITNLSRVLEEHGITIQEVVITHWHGDHIGGLPDICDHVIKDNKVKVTKFPRISKPDGELPNGIAITYVEDGHTYTTGGATLRAMYTPGHTDDHMSLYLEEENAIFSGDSILGEGSSVFEDLSTYMESLKLMQAKKASRIYSAHGALITDPEKHISDFIEHRMQRERQILAAMKDADHPLSTMEIVNIVYPVLPEKLIFGAIANVQHHLSKLCKENKVVQVGDDEKFKLVQSHL